MSNALAQVSVEKALDNLEKLIGKGDLIALVAQAAPAEINQKSTAAVTAATAAVIKIRSGAQGPKTPVFRADHPFIFMITDEETGLILFLGRLSDPGAN